ncbi:MAG: hypothetical protein LUF78_00700 [Clostridiales bacterium]|nr:hypothetical protein [Clostridiales bacterium]
MGTEAKRRIIINTLLTVFTILAVTGLVLLALTFVNLSGESADDSQNQEAVVAVTGTPIPEEASELTPTPEETWENGEEENEDDAGTARRRNSGAAAG